MRRASTPCARSLRGGQTRTHRHSQSPIRVFGSRYSLNLILIQQRSYRGLAPLTASPLELEDAELRRSLPRPWDTWSRSAIDVTVVTPREQFEVERRPYLRRHSPRQTPAAHFVLTLSGYRLEIRAKKTWPKLSRGWRTRSDRRSHVGRDVQ